MMTPFERALEGELEGSHGDRFIVCDDHDHRDGYTNVRDSTPVNSLAPCMSRHWPLPRAASLLGHLSPGKGTAKKDAGRCDRHKAGREKEQICREVGRCESRHEAEDGAGLDGHRV